MKPTPPVTRMFIRKTLGNSRAEGNYITAVWTDPFDTRRSKLIPETQVHDIRGVIVVGEVRKTRIKPVREGGIDFLGELAREGDAGAVPLELFGEAERVGSVF